LATFMSTRPKAFVRERQKTHIGAAHWRPLLPRRRAYFWPVMSM
jgi:hypothetical protein